MKRILTVAMVMTLALAAPLFAATAKDDSKGEIGFGFGHSDLGADTGVDSAQYIGVRGGYNLNPKWQIEGQFAESSGDEDVLGVNVDSTTRLIMVNGVMNFHPAKKEYVPYVMAGIGQADVDVDVAGIGSVSDNSIALQVGGGTRIFFGQAKKMAFRADLSLVRDSTFDDSNTTTNITAGLTWKLGGR